MLLSDIVNTAGIEACQLKRFVKDTYMSLEGHKFDTLIREKVTSWRLGTNNKMIFLECKVERYELLPTRSNE